MKQVHLIISGKVQGVYFRAYVRDSARTLGLKGWVRNCDNGDVEVVAQGEGKQLQQLITFCNEGPIGAKVKNVDISYELITEIFSTFEIRQ